MKLHAVIFAAIFVISFKLEHVESVNNPPPKCYVSSRDVTYPWLVYIPLKSRVQYSGDSLRCAGALISTQHVLTAESCLQFVMEKVILAHDSPDNRREISIEKRFVNDEANIVLLKLSEVVPIKDHISPICLPTVQAGRANVGDTVFTSGWGATSLEGGNSNVLKEVEHTLVDSGKCGKDDKILCLEVKENSGGKPCSGDEGSPMMTSHDNGIWTIEGVLISVFGSHSEICAVNDPSFGTKLTEDIVDWLIEQMKL